MIDKLLELLHSEIMNDEHLPLGISTEDWTATPLAVRELIGVLLQRRGALDQQVAQLQERLNQNSGNSSKPPSSDPPHAPPRPKRTPSGRKRGGPPGHSGHIRSLKPLDQVQDMIQLRPTCCGTWGAWLLGADPQPQRHQATELPRIEPHVTEYRRPTLTCVACGTKTQDAWPADMPSGDFGPRLQATSGYLSGRMGMSQHDLTETLTAVFHTDIGLGSLSAVETIVSEALVQPVTDTQTYVQQQNAANVDETGWREQAKRAWLWVAATPLVSVFLVLTTRGAKGAQPLLGETFRGIVGSDRWSAYNWLAPPRRQLGWAHLKRDSLREKLVERGGESQRLGEAFLVQVESLCRLWQRVRDGTLSRQDFQTQVAPIRTQVHTLLSEGITLAWADEH